MYALCYVSDFRHGMTIADIPELLSQCQEYNGTYAITGMLGVRRFQIFQYIEGAEEDVKRLYEKIAQDKRHKVENCVVLPSVKSRQFPGFSMAWVDDNSHKLSNPVIDALINLLELHQLGVCNDTITTTSITNLLSSMQIDSQESIVAEQTYIDSKTKKQLLECIGKRIIAIGASAGGIEPVKQLLQSLPPSLNASLVVILHLSPEHETVLDSILERETGLKVVTAEHGMLLQPGKVFLIPPGKNIEVKHAKLTLSEQLRGDAGAGKPPCPIDIFFSSIAHQYGSNAIGIVLSGTGSDGSRGVKALHENGGIAFAQDPSTAEFDGMPRSAIATGAVHRVLSIESMTEYLMKVVALGADDTELISNDENDPVVLSILETMAEHRIDFTHYKKAVILKGLERRRTLAQVESLQEYFQILLDSPEERRELKNDLLISVTNFFRDASAWEDLGNYIQEHLLPSLVTDETFRIWVAGCATGEEAYSLAMLISEIIQSGDREVDFKIYATDLSDDALEVAAKGIYSYSAVQSLDESYLSKYFTARSGGYEINSSIRERVITATHNLIQDAPFTKMHLICCRNVLIYMEPELKNQVIRLLHFSLNVGGVMFLGPSESIGAMETEFQTINREWNIYEKTREVRIPLHLSGPMLRKATPFKRSMAAKNNEKISHETDSYRTGFEALCEAQKVTALVVNAAKKISLVINDHNSLLEVAVGEPDADISKLLVPSLVPIVTINLQQINLDGKTVKSTNIVCQNNKHEDISVDIQMVKLDSVAGERRILILFAMSNLVSVEANIDTPLPVTADVDGSMASQLADTQWQLDETRRVLFDTIEELEFSNEQQQSTNEQLTAANEELQSTNEELQSVNEELYTVNFEYQSKIHELSDLTHDLNNLLESTNLGVIFLDSELCVRRFTDRAAKILRLMPTDVGSPIDKVVQHLEYPDLKDVIARVMSLSESHERDISFDGCPDRLHVGVYPYRVESELSQGVIISMLDLAELNSFAVDQIPSSEKETA